MGRELFYSDDVIKLIIETGRFAIYDAGTMGRAVKKCLTEKPYLLEVSAFIVRSMSDNDNMIDGVRVLDIAHAGEYKDELVLIALNGKLIPEAYADLKAAGFTNIVQVSFDGDAWTAIRSSWIRANSLLPDGVVFMADLANQQEPNPAQKNEASSRKGLHIYVVHSIYDRELSNIPAESIYDIPIQVGAALTDKHLFKTLDSSGVNNISAKNKQYCELTGIYWAWKNDTSNYVGFCHYRRKFDLSVVQIDHIFSGDIDVIVTVPILNFAGVRKQYGKDHVIGDWDTFIDVISDTTPRYLDAAKAVQDGIYYYAYNMFIMKRDVFDEYCGFIFPILEECEKRIGDKEDTYQNRYVGFLAERLLSIFLTKHSELKVFVAEKRFYE